CARYDYDLHYYAMDYW
nr:immunoglobulin heavy chain junction region [Mus musculus]NSM07523.1 immunoglobulin heavy chain junction region [Mus musculus]